MQQTPKPADAQGLEKVVTEKVVAEVLGWKPEALQADRMREVPRIPFFRLGRSVRYAISDVRDFLERHKVGARP